MRAKPAASSPSPLDLGNAPSESEPDQTGANIEAVLEFYTREERKISRSQRFLERLSGVIGQPAFLGFILLFVVLWILANLGLRHLGMTEFDRAPFFWLQGLVGLGALLTATVVLTKQNRFAKLEEQRAHLDLKVTLLTEQRTAKLIGLLEELRRDMPNVRDRHDPEAVALQQSMNPHRVLAALDERKETDERLKPAGRARDGADDSEQNRNSYAGARATGTGEAAELRQAVNQPSAFAAPGADAKASPSAKPR